jgi:hypothetical protein
VGTWHGISTLKDTPCGRSCEIRLEPTIFDATGLS